MAQLREEAAVTEEIDAQLAAYEKALAKYYTDKRARSAGRKRSIESVESAALVAESFFQTLGARVRTCLFDQPDAIGPLLGLLPRLPERRAAAKPASAAQASAS